MNPIKDLRDLFIEQGRELYEASRQEENALPGILQQTHNSGLRTIINKELETARIQRNRLEDAFRKLKVEPKGEKNTCCESIINQTMDLIQRSTVPEVRDAVIINTIQRLNHLKMTGFGSLAAYAQQIGEKEISHIVHEALEEERGIDRDLSHLAEKEINARAAHTLLV